MAGALFSNILNLDALLFRPVSVVIGYVGQVSGPYNNCDSSSSYLVLSLFGKPRSKLS